MLATDQVVASPETHLEYRIERLLGKGGFGEVYLARRVGHSPEVPETVCIKVSTHMDGWLREAYFGQLLNEHPRAIRVFDTFPLMRPGEGVLYCLALEYARHGDLSAFLQRETRRWSEALVRREIAGILEVLGKLHRGQMLHRDLPNTPLPRASTLRGLDERHEPFAWDDPCWDDNPYPASYRVGGDWDERLATADECPPIASPPTTPRADRLAYAGAPFSWRISWWATTPPENRY